MISRWDIRFLYEKIIDDPDELDWFLTNVVTPEWHFQHDAGRAFADTSAELIAEYPEQARRISIFQHRFNETNPGEIDGIAPLIARLFQAEVPLFGLSNFSAEFWPPFRLGKSVFDHFGDILISGEEKMVKPDPDIYRLALKRFERTADQCLFIDDRQENIEGCEGVGIRGHLFQNASLLESDLSDLGLL